MKKISQRVRSAPLRRSEIPLLLTGLLPILVLVLGHLLFDLVGSSFARHAVELVANKTTNATPSSAIPAGQFWAGTSLTYIVVAAGAIAYVLKFLRMHVRGRAMLPLASFSVLLIVLGIAHLLWVDSSRQPVSIIFYLTYDSLQNSLTMHPQDLHSVRKILDIINLLSVIVPSLFCAFMPSVLLTPQQGWTESILTQRVKAG